MSLENMECGSRKGSCGAREGRKNVELENVERGGEKGRKSV